jgi:hypothetical protein
MNNKSFIGKYIDNELVDVYLVEKDVKLSDLKLQVEEVSDAKCILIFFLCIHISCIVFIYF